MTTIARNNEKMTNLIWKGVISGTEYYIEHYRKLTDEGLELGDSYEVCYSTGAHFCYIGLWDNKATVLPGIGENEKITADKLAAILLAETRY